MIAVIQRPRGACESNTPRPKELTRTVCCRCLLVLAYLPRLAEPFLPALPNMFPPPVPSKSHQDVDQSSSQTHHFPFTHKSSRSLPLPPLPLSLSPNPSSHAQYPQVPLDLPHQSEHPHQRSQSSLSTHPNPNPASISSTSFSTRIITPAADSAATKDYDGPSGSTCTASIAAPTRPPSRSRLKNFHLGGWGRKNSVDERKVDGVTVAILASDDVGLRDASRMGTRTRTGSYRGHTEPFDGGAQVEMAIASMRTPAETGPHLQSRPHERSLSFDPSNVQRLQTSIPMNSGRGSITGMSKSFRPGRSPYSSLKGKEKERTSGLTDGDEQLKYGGFGMETCSDTPSDTADEHPRVSHVIRATHAQTRAHHRASLRLRCSLQSLQDLRMGMGSPSCTSPFTAADTDMDNSDYFSFRHENDRSKAIIYEQEQEQEQEYEHGCVHEQEHEQEYDEGHIPIQAQVDEHTFHRHLVHSLSVSTPIPRNRYASSPSRHGSSRASAGAGAGIGPPNIPLPPTPTNTNAYTSPHLSPVLGPLRITTSDLRLPSEDDCRYRRSRSRSRQSTVEYAVAAFPLATEVADDWQGINQQAEQDDSLVPAPMLTLPQFEPLRMSPFAGPSKSPRSLPQSRPPPFRSTSTSPKTVPEPASKDPRNVTRSNATVQFQLDALWDKFLDDVDEAEQDSSHPSYPAHNHSTLPDYHLHLQSPLSVQIHPQQVQAHRDLPSLSSAFSLSSFDFPSPPSASGTPGGITSTSSSSSHTIRLVRAPNGGAPLTDSPMSLAVSSEQTEPENDTQTATTTATATHRSAQVLTYRPESADRNSYASSSSTTASSSSFFPPHTGSRFSRLSSSFFHQDRHDRDRILSTASTATTLTFSTSGEPLTPIWGGEFEATLSSEKGNGIGMMGAKQNEAMDRLLSVGKKSNANSKLDSNSNEEGEALAKLARLIFDSSDDEYEQDGNGHNDDCNSVDEDERNDDPETDRYGKDLLTSSQELWCSRARVAEDVVWGVAM